MLPGACYFDADQPFDRSELLVGNLDGSGGFDVVVPGWIAGPESQVRVYANVLATTPDLEGPAAVIAPAGSTVAYLADVDGDGLDDIAVPHSEAFTSDWLDVYLSPLPPGNRAPETYDLRINRSRTFGPMAAMDFDRLGEPELVTVDVDVFLVHDPVFDDPPATLTEDDAVARVEADGALFDEVLLVADLTADGDSDVLLLDDSVGKVIADPVQFTVHVDEVAAATLSSSSKASGRAFDDAVEPDAGDVDGDGATDLFYQTSSDRYLGVAPGPFVGDVDLDTRTAAVIEPHLSELRDIALGDLDGDGFDDLLIAVEDDINMYDRDLLWVVYGPVEGTWTLDLDPRYHERPDDLPNPPDSAVLVFPDAAARLEPLVAGDFVGDDADEALVGYCAERDDGPNAWLIGGTPF